jgi:YHS domain-containing protein
MNITHATTTTPTKSTLPRLAVMGLAALVAVAFGAIANAATTNAQYNGQCAEGMAEGQHVVTDCSVNWTAKDGKEYCFGNEAAKAKFLKNPRGQIKKADAFAAAHPQS